jgi:hypothetical protein
MRGNSRTVKVYNYTHAVNVSIGLIGGGNITDTHARAVRAVAGAEVAAIYGANIAKVKRLSHEHGGQAYAEIDAFLRHRPMDMSSGAGRRSIMRTRAGAGPGRWTEERLSSD